MGIIYVFAFIGSGEKLYNFKRLKIGSPFSLQINIDGQIFLEQTKMLKYFFKP